MSQKDGSTEKREVTLQDAKSCQVSFHIKPDCLQFQLWHHHEANFQTG